METRSSSQSAHKSQLSVGTRVESSPMIPSCRLAARGAQQLPPEAWLRFSLPHASLTHLVIRPSGDASLRMMGDAGHLPPEMVTY